MAKPVIADISITEWSGNFADGQTRSRANFFGLVKSDSFPSETAKVGFEEVIAFSAAPDSTYESNDVSTSTISKQD